MVKTRGVKNVNYLPNYTPPPSPKPKRKLSKAQKADIREWKPSLEPTMSPHKPSVATMIKIINLYDSGRSIKSIEAKYNWFQRHHLSSFRQKLKELEAKAEKPSSEPATPTRDPSIATMRKILSLHEAGHSETFIADQFHGFRRSQIAGFKRKLKELEAEKRKSGSNFMRKLKEIKDEDRIKQQSKKLRRSRGGSVGSSSDEKNSSFRESEKESSIEDYEDSEEEESEEEEVSEPEEVTPKKSRKQRR